MKSSLSILTNRRAARVIPALVRVLVVLAGLFVARTSSAQLNVTPPELQHVGVDEHLDQPLPLDTTFRDESGKTVSLRSFYDGKRPVMLTFAYHSCPVLCSMVLNAAVQGLKEVPWTVGKEFDIVTISIDPKESAQKTADKRAALLGEYGRVGTGSNVGWHFLTGDETSIAAVADAAGFRYSYDERQEQYGHPSVVMITTPEGKMARYLYGIEFAPQDLRLGLLEASQGRSISTVEKLIMYCYHYDPQGGKYVLVAMRVMQVGAMMVAALVASILAILWTRELRNKQGPGGPGSGQGRDDKRPDDKVEGGAARRNALGV